MRIKGLEGLAAHHELDDEISKGGKFIIYKYSLSCIVLTVRKTSKIIFVKSTQSRISPGIIYSLISLILGWWGIPWGPIYTISAIYKNFRGGIDITDTVMQQINGKHGDLRDVHIIL